MANSTTVITDLGTLAGTNYNAASIAKAKTTDNIDLPGMANTALEAASALKRNLQLLQANTDATDAQHTLIGNILGTLS